MEDWGVEGPAVGSFADWEEGDEFTGEPDNAVVVIVSMESLTVFVRVSVVFQL